MRRSPDATAKAGHRDLRRRFAPGVRTDRGHPHRGDERPRVVRPGPGVPEPDASCRSAAPYARIEIRGEDDVSATAWRRGRDRRAGRGSDAGLLERPAGDGDTTCRRLGAHRGHRSDRCQRLPLRARPCRRTIIGGFNIWPAELETVIAEPTRELSRLNFSAPHAKWGETPVAVCQVMPDATLIEEDVIATCRDRLGRQTPDHRRVHERFAAAQPVGKIQRKLLRERIGTANHRRVAGS